MDNNDEFNNSSSNNVEVPKKKKRGISKFLVIVVIIVLFHAFRNNGWSFSLPFVGTSTNSESFTTSNSLRALSVNLSSTDVFVESTSANETRVQVTGSKNLVDNISFVLTNNNTLTVTQQTLDSNNSFFDSLLSLQFFGAKGKIVIYLPEKQYNTLDLSTSSGNITIDNLKSKEVSISTSSGNQIIDGIEFRSMTTRASSGNISLNKIKGNDLRIVTSSGNQTINDASVKTVDLSASSGNISADNLTATNAEANTSSGNTKLDFFDTNKIVLNGNSSSGNISITFDSDIELNISSNKDVKTDFVSNSKSKNKVNLTTSSGSLRVSTLSN